MLFTEYKKYEFLIIKLEKKLNLSSNLKKSIEVKHFITEDGYNATLV